MVWPLPAHAATRFYATRADHVPSIGLHAGSRAQNQGFYWPSAKRILLIPDSRLFIAPETRRAAQSCGPARWAETRAASLQAPLHATAQVRWLRIHNTHLPKQRVE